MKKILKLVRRCRKKNKPKDFLPVYDICIVNASSRGKKVYDKLGVINLKARFMQLNTFRLAYWLARGVRLTGNASRVLEENNFFHF